MLQTFLSAFIPLFIIVNPSSTLALFSIVTSKCTRKERISVAKKAVIYAVILLFIFAFAGSSILQYLGISIPALRIAGGILLGFVGLDMLRRGEQFGEALPDKKQPSPEDYALVPLALPSLSGPGAITVTIVSMQTIDNALWFVIPAIVLTMIITFAVFMSSIIIIKILGKKGMDALTRVMGLLTVAIAVQFALTGIAEWLPTLPF
ncbi:MAG: MarC family protein [Candidatus Thermoplasmatota archaeon]|nr:MarC family protein [Candidatus Thermoplasmatota archaeon]